MTNALAKLARAKATDVSPADAIKLATNALNDLDDTKRWTKDLNSRNLQITSLTTQANQIKNSAQTAMDTAAAQVKCQQAVASAQKAEQDGKWSDAYALWQQAQTACGANSDVTGGMRFATNMLGVIAALDDAERKAGGDETNANIALNTSSKALSQLNSISNLVSSTSRKNEWDARQKRLMAARTRAQETLDTMQKSRACEAARASARDAEKATNWVEAVQRWDLAKGKCPDTNGEIASGRTFATAITDAMAKLAQARSSGTNGASIAEPAIRDLSDQSKLATSDVRKGALNVVSNDLFKVGLEADRELGNALFTQGNYADAVRVCAKHPELADLKSSIDKEKNALTAFQDAFAKGEYSFLNQPEVQTYGKRPVFVNLVPEATRERQTLSELRTLHASTNWSEVLNRQQTAGSATYWSKRPFSNELAWARDQQSQYQRLVTARLAGLDARLEVMQVNFGLLSSRRAVSADAKKAEKLGPIGTASSQYLSECDNLEKGFQQASALDKERQATLTRLRDKIRVWDSSF